MSLCGLIYELRFREPLFDPSHASKVINVRKVIASSRCFVEQCVKRLFHFCRNFAFRELELIVQQCCAKHNTY